MQRKTKPRARRRAFSRQACAGVLDYSVSDGKPAEICAILQKAHIHLIVHSRYAACRDVRKLRESQESSSPCDTI